MGILVGLIVRMARLMVRTRHHLPPALPAAPATGAALFPLASHPWAARPAGKGEANGAAGARARGWCGWRSRGARRENIDSGGDGRQRSRRWQRSCAAAARLRKSAQRRLGEGGWGGKGGRTALRSRWCWWAAAGVEGHPECSYLLRAGVRSCGHDLWHAAAGVSSFVRAAAGKKACTAPPPAPLTTAGSCCERRLGRNEAAQR